MVPGIRELATLNLVVICLVVLVGFVFLKVVKKRMED